MNAGETNEACAQKACFWGCFLGKLVRSQRSAETRCVEKPAIQAASIGSLPRIWLQASEMFFCSAASGTASRSSAVRCAPAALLILSRQPCSQQCVQGPASCAGQPAAQRDIFVFVGAAQPHVQTALKSQVSSQLSARRASCADPWRRFQSEAP